MSEGTTPGSTEHHISQGESPPPGNDRPMPEDSPARYVPVRYHAAGGMGVISVALDRQFQREVAFKEIKQEHADSDEAIVRFVREAEVTGQLQHPGIVPVYSLGHHADGRPFYAMRFIQGETLHHEIRQFHEGPRTRESSERSLALQRLLRRFIDVCNTMGYAHSRGFLHRDLKPANVMLGPFGETLVVDWGLAKSVRGGIPDYLPPGNPFSAPPTQSTGNTTPDSTLVMPPVVPEIPIDAGPATDRIDPRHPSTSVASEPRTRLGSVMGTAAYMSPEQARGLIDLLSPASDLYSLGATLYEILTGHPPFDGTTTSEVLRKVCSGEFPRPREVLPAVPRELEAIVLRAMAYQPRERYPGAREMANDLEKWLADLEAEAIAAVKAREALQSAQEQRQLALETLRKLVEDIDSQLKHQPGLQGVRKVLLRDVLNGLQQVARAADTTDAIDHQTIAVHFELGDIFLYFETGGAREAAVQYRKAHELARSFAEQQPESVVAQRDLSRSWRRLGDVELRTGNTGPALEAYEKSLEVARRLSERDPDNREIRRDLSVAWEKYGDILVQRGDAQHALGVYQVSLDLRLALVQQEPSTSARKDLTRAWIKLGNVLARLSKPDQALASFREGLSLAQQLAEEEPGDASALRHLCRALGRTGDLQLQLGNFADALETYQQNVDICQQLAQQDPGNLQVRSDLSKGWNRLGDAFAQMGEPRRALSTHQNALMIAQELTSADPSNAPMQRDLSFILSKMGELHHRLGELGPATAAFDRMVGIRQRLAQADRANAQAHRDLQGGLMQRAYLNLERQSYAEAIEWFEAALRVSQEFARPDYFRTATARIQKKLEELRILRDQPR